MDNDATTELLRRLDTAEGMIDHLATLCETMTRIIAANQRATRALVAEADRTHPGFALALREDGP